MIMQIGATPGAGRHHLREKVGHSAEFSARARDRHGKLVNSHEIFFQLADRPIARSFATRERVH